MWKYSHTNSLCHSGVKGMKWGVHISPDIQFAKNDRQFVKNHVRGIKLHTKDLIRYENKLKRNTKKSTSITPTVETNNRYDVARNRTIMDLSAAGGANNKEEAQELINAYTYKLQQLEKNPKYRKKIDKYK